MSFDLYLAAANSPAWLILGLSELNAPFKGGVLVPDPAPPGTIWNASTNFLGTILIPWTWPTGVPSGLNFYMQYWIKDINGPLGFTASDCLKLHIP